MKAIKNSPETVFSSSKEGANLWNQYVQAVDPKDEWFTISDETTTGIANFVAYDLTSMLISGGVAGLAGRGAIALAGRSASIASRLDRVAVSAGKLNSLGRGAIATGRATIEGTTFTATHAAVRNQEWFMNQPDVTKQIVLNSLMFGAIRFASATQIPGSYFGKNPVVEGLMKQGLIVPAMITGAQLGLFDYDRIINTDPSLWNDIWSSFLLNALMGGMVGMHGKFNTARLMVSEGTIRLPEGKSVSFRTTEVGKYEMELPVKGGTKWVEFEPSAQVKKELDRLNSPRSGTVDGHASEGRFEGQAGNMAEFTNKMTQIDLVIKSLLSGQRKVLRDEFMAINKELKKFDEMSTADRTNLMGRLVKLETSVNEIHRGVS